MSRKKLSFTRRSGCPLNASVEMLGDRWSLLIIRDMMLRGSRTFKEFLDSYERIATNVLSDRLNRLESYGIIRSQTDPSDRRRPAGDDPGHPPVARPPRLLSLARARPRADRRAHAARSSGARRPGALEHAGRIRRPQRLSKIAGA